MTSSNIRCHPIPNSTAAPYQTLPPPHPWLHCSPLTYPNLPPPPPFPAVASCLTLLPPSFLDSAASFLTWLRHCNLPSSATAYFPPSPIHLSPNAIVGNATPASSFKSRSFPPPNLSVRTWGGAAWHMVSGVMYLYKATLNMEQKAVVVLMWWYVNA